MGSQQQQQQQRRLNKTMMRRRSNSNIKPMIHLLSFVLLLLAQQQNLLCDEGVVVFAAAEEDAGNDSNNDDSDINNKTTTTTTDRFVVGGYLPNYRLPVLQDMMDAINSDKSTAACTNKKKNRMPLTDLMLFSIEPSSKGTIDGECCLGDGHFRSARELKESLKTKNGEDNGADDDDEQSTLNVWLTLGGAGRTESFGEICADEVLTEVFIDAVSDLCTKEGIYGVDLDMFRPTSEEHQECLMDLIMKATDGWHKAGLKVSMTLLPANQELPPLNIFDAVDRINMMAYDLFTKGPDEETGLWQHHSSLESVQAAVNILLAPGTRINSEKVILGIPMYGRNLKDPNQVKTYYEIYDGIVEDKGVVSSPDTLSQWQDYEWDSPDAIEQKILLAKNKDLGGIFFWEIGQDKRTDTSPMGELLEKVSTVLDEIKSLSSTEDRELWDNEEL